MTSFFTLPAVREMACDSPPSEAGLYEQTVDGRPRESTCRQRAALIPVLGEPVGLLQHEPSRLRGLPAQPRAAARRQR